ncbi:MAG TPA: TIGR03667 family PPOX class F420-dependent oxidoreductase [Ktedonobacterales bacterium]|jgi:PPOX class probable F420-dependent enzyme
MSNVMPDESTEFGVRVARQLREEVVIWLTTVGADGTPQPNPVWFVWDGATILIYSQRDAKRNAHVRARPRVALHFDTVDQGEYATIITGEAAIEAGVPLAHENPDYAAKYAERMAGLAPDQDVAAFAAEYPVAIRITPGRVRGF